MGVQVRITLPLGLERPFQPEFEGFQCYIRFHKGWNKVCEYVTKEDKREEGGAPIFLNELRRVRRSGGVKRIVFSASYL
jgi:hypothetical protein|nr:hypothetical protein Q903MT_gene1265 [Picea sitchensis]